MTGKLTAGFDLVAQITRDGVNQLLRLWNRFPRKVSAQITDTTGESAQLDIYIDHPYVNFRTGASNKVVLRIPYIARVSTADSEASGELSVEVAVEKTRMHQDDKDTDIIAITIPEKGFENLILDNGGLPEGLLQSKVTELLANTLRNHTIELAPPINSKDIAFWTFKVYGDGKNKDPGSGYADPNYLGIFAKLNTDSRQPPKNWLPLVRRPPELVIAISKEVFRRICKDALAANGLDKLPAPVPGHEQHKLTKLRIDLDNKIELVSRGPHYLADYFLKIAGTVDDVVDFETGFSLSLQIGESEQKAQLRADRLFSKVDAKWWLKIASLFVLGGPSILDSILKALKVTMGAAGEELSDSTLSEMTLFATKPPVPDQEIEPLFNRLRIEGRVDISPGGLVVPGWVDEHSPPRKPPYIIGHVKSREFHCDDCNCISERKILFGNRKVFIRPDVALREGFNGCRWCQSDYDYAMGKLGLHLKMTSTSPGAPPAETPQVEFKYAIRGNRTGPPIGGVEVDAAFGEAEELLTLERDRNKAEWIGNREMPPLVPGDWEIEISSGGWSHTFPVRVRQYRWNRKRGEFVGETFVGLAIGKLAHRVAYDRKVGFP